MNEIIKNIEAAQLKETVPSFNVGDTVRVSAKIKEGNRERIQVFEGTVIKRQNGGVRETFTVRKNSNGIGVEKTWPLHSPSVENIEVVRRGKVRRAKLYYLRDRVGKAAKVISKIVRVADSGGQWKLSPCCVTGENGGSAEQRRDAPWIFMKTEKKTGCRPPSGGSSM